MNSTAAIVVVALAALWAAAEAQSSEAVKEGASLAVENMREKAEIAKESVEDAKDKTHSWTGWAYEKITHGNAEESEDGRVDRAMAEKATDAKNSAGESIKMVTDKASDAKGSMIEGAKEKMNQAADMAGQAKQKAGDMYSQTSEL